MENIFVELPNGLTEDELNSSCQNRMNDFNQYVKPYLDRAEDSQKLIQCKAVNGQIPNAPVVPVAHSQYETSLANIMRVCFGRPKVIECKPRFYTDSTERVDTVEDFINQEVLFSEGHRIKGRNIISRCLAEGISIVKSVWEKKSTIQFKDIRSKLADESGNFPIVGQETIEVNKGRWSYERINLKNCGWDPRCNTTIPDSEWFFEIHYYSKAELLKKEQDGLISGVEYICQNIAPEKAPGDNSTAKTWKVIEWWGNCQWEIDGENGKQQVIQNSRWMMCGKKCIQFAENPLSPQRIPYCGVPYQPDEEGIIGNTVFTPIRDLSVSTTNQMEKKRRVIDKIVSQPIFYEPASGLDVERLKGNVGAYVAVKNAGAITRLPNDPAPINALREDISSNIGMMNSATPANEQFQGVGGDDGTATEANINYQAGGTRFGEVVETINNYFFVWAGKECLLMYRQFGNDGDMWVSESSINGETKMITKDELSGDYDVIALGASAEANKRADIKNKLEMIKVISDGQRENPAFITGEDGMPQEFKIGQFIVREALPAVGVKNGQSYIGPKTIQNIPQMPAPIQGGTPEINVNEEQTSGIPPGVE